MLLQEPARQLLVGLGAEEGLPYRSHHREAAQGAVGPNETVELALQILQLHLCALVYLLHQPAPQSRDLVFDLGHGGELCGVQQGGVGPHTKHHAVAVEGVRAREQVKGTSECGRLAVLAALVGRELDSATLHRIKLLFQKNKKKKRYIG